MSLLFGQIGNEPILKELKKCSYCDQELDFISVRYIEKTALACPNCDSKYRLPDQIPLPISFVTLDQFFKCSQRWSWFQQRTPTNMTDNRRKKGGILLHEVFHQYFENLENQRPKKKDISSLIKTQFKLAWRQSPILSLEEEIKKSYTNFIKMEERRWTKERESYLPTFTEQAILSLPFKGVIDWYNEETGIIRDWKTLRWFVPQKDSYKRQALIYTALIQSLGKEVKQIIFEETYHQKSIVFNIYPGMKNELMGLVKQYKEAVLNKYFTKTRTRVCNRYCPYQIRCEAQDQHQTLWSVSL